MFCPNCGTRIPDDSAFCPECGSKTGVDSTSAATVSPEKKPKIQNSLAPQTPEPTPEAPAQKKSLRWLYILISILCVVVLVAAIAIAIHITATKEPVSSNEAATAPPQKVDEAYKKEYFPTVDPSLIDEYQAYSTYTLVISDATWTQASDDAQGRGKKLACINNQDEFDTLCSFADNENISVFWIGAKRHESDDWTTARWVDGTEIAFTKWLDHEPSLKSETGEEECYLLCFKVDDQWYYNDAENDVSMHYSGKMGYFIETEITTHEYYTNMSASNLENLNEYLSTLSEVFFTAPGNTDNLYYELLSFAVAHLHLNRPEEVSFEGDDMLVSYDSVNKVLTDMFNTTLPEQTIESSLSGYPWTYTDGSFVRYGQCTESHAYFTIANDAYKNNDGTITVDFSVYHDASDAYDYHAADWYSLTPAEAMDQYDFVYNGYAVLKSRVINGRSTYELIQYTTIE